MLVRAPGRVNLIGEHTDYTGGLVMPMAIDRCTEIRGQRVGDRMRLTSADRAGVVDVPLLDDQIRTIEPEWGRYVAAVVAELSPTVGFVGHITTDIPVGAGLSSSAALEVALALALGSQHDSTELAQLCRRAEHAATGVPTGIMDQLSITSGVAGHALVIDCHSLEVTPVPIPDDLEIVVQFIAHRTLEGSPYAERVAQCAAAERAIGPLRLATTDMARSIDDPAVRRRALHVTGENQRVRDFAKALSVRDLGVAGELMVEGHRSLADLYDCSTSAMDAAVDRLLRTPGVYGARMTGGGFGGCVVALTEPGALPDGWVVAAVDGARVVEP